MNALSIMLESPCNTYIYIYIYIHIYVHIYIYIYIYELVRETMIDHLPLIPLSVMSTEERRNAGMDIKTAASE